MSRLSRRLRPRTSSNHDDGERGVGPGCEVAERVRPDLSVRAKVSEVPPVDIEERRLPRDVEAAPAADRDESVCADLGPSIEQIERRLDALVRGRPVEDPCEPVTEPFAYRVHQVLVGADVRAADDEGVTEFPFVEGIAEFGDAPAAVPDLTALIVVFEGVCDR